jgi:hypothetical protein
VNDPSDCAIIASISQTTKVAAVVFRPSASLCNLSLTIKISPQSQAPTCVLPPSQPPSQLLTLWCAATAAALPPLLQPNAASGPGACSRLQPARCLLCAKTQFSCCFMTTFETLAITRCVASLSIMCCRAVVNAVLKRAASAALIHAASEGGGGGSLDASDGGGGVQKKQKQKKGAVAGRRLHSSEISSSSSSSRVHNKKRHKSRSAHVSAASSPEAASPAAAAEASSAASAASVSTSSRDKSKYTLTLAILKTLGLEEQAGAFMCAPLRPCCC